MRIVSAHRARLATPFRRSPFTKILLRSCSPRKVIISWSVGNNDSAGTQSSFCTMPRKGRIPTRERAALATAHLREMPLAQHNIYYRTLLRSALRARFQKVFLGGSQKPGSHKASCTHKDHVKPQPRCTLCMRFGVARLRPGVAAFRGKGSRLPSKPRCGTAGLVPVCLWTPRWSPAVPRRTAGPRRAGAVPHADLKAASTRCHKMRPHPQRDPAEKVLANGGRSGYYARVNLDTGGEEV